MITLAVVIYFLVRDFQIETLYTIDWGWKTGLFLFIACGLVVLRHLALMFRIKVLTNHKLSWWQSFQVISLWEFGSSVTPSTVGGTAVAYFLLTKEKISAGETISVVLFTIFLDGLFFLIGIPLLYIFLGKWLLVPTYEAATGMQGVPSVLVGTFIFAYIFMVFYTLTIAYGLFVNPRSFKWFMIKMTAGKGFMSRYRSNAVATGNDMIIASERLKEKGRDYWIAGIGSTVVNWSTRFFIMNFVMLALHEVGSHMLLFSRQLVIYIMMIPAITPGGSGIAEWASNNLLNDFFVIEGANKIDNSLKTIVITLWRAVSYMVYLVLGMIVMPGWLKKVVKAKPKKKKIKAPKISAERV